MANEEDHTERNQKIKEEFDELTRRGSHDTVTAVDQLSLQHKVKREEVLALVRPTEQPRTQREDRGDQRDDDQRREQPDEDQRRR